MTEGLESTCVAGKRRSEGRMEYGEVVVTVLCVCYNHARSLRRALESLVSQKTDFAYELLVHDDASTDGSQDIIREFQRRYPQIVRPMLEEENQYGQGRNFLGKMLAEARGSYIAYCETDDFWSDSLKLQLQVDALRTHPECSFCVHNTQGVNIRGDRLPQHFPPIRVDAGAITPEEYLRHELFEDKWMFQLSSFMSRRETMVEYEEISASEFPSKYYQVGDQPLFLFCLTKGSAWYIDRDMSCYTVDSGGFMTSLGKGGSFCERVQLGYIQGLEAFDAYSHGRFATAIQRAVLRRQFLYDLATHNYRAISNGKYKDLNSELGSLRRLRYRFLGRLRHGQLQDHSAEEPPHEIVR